MGAGRSNLTGYNVRTGANTDPQCRQAKDFKSDIYMCSLSALDSTAIIFTDETSKSTPTPALPIQTSTASQCHSYHPLLPYNHNRINPP